MHFYMHSYLDKKIILVKSGCYRSGGGGGWGGVGVPVAVPHGGANGAERGGVGFGDIDRHGTDVVALGCSDSGGRRTPRGRGD
jgi:hypothetical protein